MCQNVEIKWPWKEENHNDKDRVLGASEASCVAEGQLLSERVVWLLNKSNKYYWLERPRDRCVEINGISG